MNGYRADWCQQHFLNYKNLRKVQEIRSQLLDIIKSQKMRQLSCGTNWDPVRKAICSAYFNNAVRLKGVGEYVNLLTGMPCFLHPSSALYTSGSFVTYVCAPHIHSLLVRHSLLATPEYAVYHELTFTTKEYMQFVTAVDPLWLAELGPMFFQVKESFRSRLEKRRLEREDTAAMERNFEEEMKARVEAEEEAKRSRVTPGSGMSSARRIVTPGGGGSSTVGRGGSATPARTPRRLGL